MLGETRAKLILRMTLFCLDELEENIRTAVASIGEDTLKRVFLNFQRRLVLCTENDESHFERQI